MREATTRSFLVASRTCQMVTWLQTMTFGPFEALNIQLGSAVKMFSVVSRVHQMAQCLACHIATSECFLKKIKITKETAGAWQQVIMLIIWTFFFFFAQTCGQLLEWRQVTLLNSLHNYTVVKRGFTLFVPMPGWGLRWKHNTTWRQLYFVNFKRRFKFSITHYKVTNDTP